MIFGWLLGFLFLGILAVGFVLIVKGSSQRLLSQELFFAIINKDTEKLLKSRFRLITVSGVDGKLHTYYGFAPDKMYVVRSNRRIELDAYVAVCESDILFGDCDGIAHPSLLA